MLQIWKICFTKKVWICWESSYCIQSYEYFCKKKTKSKYFCVWNRGHRVTVTCGNNDVFPYSRSFSLLSGNWARKLFWREKRCRDNGRRPFAVIAMADVRPHWIKHVRHFHKSNILRASKGKKWPDVELIDFPRKTDVSWWALDVVCRYIIQYNMFVWNVY